MKRRDLLKAIGIGAVIAPTVGKAADNPYEGAIGSVKFTKVSEGYCPQRGEVLSIAKSGNKYLVLGCFSTKEELADLTERTDKYREKNQTWLRYK